MFDPAQEELTMGQRLALKHLLVDPKEKERQEAEKAAEEAAAAKADEAESSEAESEWTWETCSESEAEELEEDVTKKTEPQTSTVIKPVRIWTILKTNILKLKVVQTWTILKWFSKSLLISISRNG